MELLDRIAEKYANLGILPSDYYMPELYQSRGSAQNQSLGRATRSD